MDNQINTIAEEFQIIDLWHKYKRYWMWFAVSIVVCCSIGIFKIKITPKQYMRTASVLIKDDRSTTDIAADFSGRNIVSQNSNVKNEIEAFKSPNLIQAVVEQLNLTVQYSQTGKLKSEELYGRSPIEVLFPDVFEDISLGFQLEIAPGDNVTISKFFYRTEKLNGTVTGKLNDTIKTPIGKVVIKPTNHYDSQWYFIPLKVNHYSVNDVTASMIKKLILRLSSKDNSIIVLEFSDPVTSRAEDFLNTLIDVYDENWIYEKNKGAKSTAKLLDEMLDLAMHDLKIIDYELEDFKRRNLLTNVQEAASISLSQSSSYSTKIMEISNQLSITNLILGFLGKNEGISTTLPVFTGLNHSGIEAQISQYNTILLNRDNLIANGNERNPIVEDLNNQLRTLRASIIQAVEKQIEALEMQMSGLKTEEARTTRNIASNPAQARELENIAREQKSKAEVYSYLLQKKAENDMALATAEANTRIISPPTGTNSPVAPKKNLILLAAIFIGCALPVGAIWGKEMLDITVRGKEDLSAMSVPFLGVIPQVKKEDLKDGMLLVNEKGRDIHNESFRMVRTSLDIMYGKDSQILMFTSLESGAGKTYTAINLAMSMAIAGKKVVLVDLDLRKAILSRMISLPELGINCFINGAVKDIRKIIQKDYLYPGLDVIPVGEIPHNPTELLINIRFQLFLDKLRSTYDYIFLDCTTLDIMADAAIVGRYADLAVFTVREGHTDRRAIPELEKIYRTEQFKNMVVLLNGSKKEDMKKNFPKYTSEIIKEVKLLPKYEDESHKLLEEGKKYNSYE